MLLCRRSSLCARGAAPELHWELAAALRPRGCIRAFVVVVAATAEKPRKSCPLEGGAEKRCALEGGTRLAASAEAGENTEAQSSDVPGLRRPARLAPPAKDVASWSAVRSARDRWTMRPWICSRGRALRALLGREGNAAARLLFVALGQKMIAGAGPHSNGAAAGSRRPALGVGGLGRGMQMTDGEDECHTRYSDFFNHMIRVVVMPTSSLRD
ncbi:unnamed protein product [Prorocentrum cordatum]|uniref:Uncharacterized protein n=1 Tax=Prorocentrum cordatum TaxID=2364126 RepID=A0ABN9X1T4_9DINO|nr:unnamed protein product [Polarella glacialis]